MNEKLCCKYQELVLECIYTQNFQEYWKSMEGWSRCGKFDEKGEVKFDCSNCSEFYDYIVKTTGIDRNSKKVSLEKIREVGCCNSIYMIRNLDDEVDTQKLGIWLNIFKDIMCENCSETVKKVSEVSSSLF